MNLSELIAECANKAIKSQDENGAVPAVHNGLHQLNDEPLSSGDKDWCERSKQKGFNWNL